MDATVFISSRDGRTRAARRIARPLAVAAIAVTCWILLASCAGGRNAISPDGPGGSPPETHTQPASRIFTDRAVLHGTVGPLEVPGRAWFEFGIGPDPAGWTATPARNIPPSREPRPLRAEVAGLTPYRSYHYRAVATTAAGTRRGEIREFPTGVFYVAVGDSITAGAQGGGFEPLLAELLTHARGVPVTVKNLGVSGTSSANGLRIVSFALSSFPWAKHYLIMYGTNDAAVSARVPSGKGLHPGQAGYAGSYKANLQKIVSTLLAAGKIPCLAKVPYATNPSIDIHRIHEYNAVIEEVVAENRLETPPPDFFRHFQNRTDELADGIHPNRAGYGSIAELWLAALGG